MWPAAHVASLSAAHSRPTGAGANQATPLRFHARRAATSPVVGPIDGLSPPLLSRRPYGLSMLQPPKPPSSLVQALAAKEATADSRLPAIPPLSTVATCLRVAPRHCDRLLLPPLARRKCANGKVLPEPDGG